MENTFRKGMPALQNATVLKRRNKNVKQLMTVMVLPLRVMYAEVFIEYLMDPQPPYCTTATGNRLTYTLTH